MYFIDIFIALEDSRSKKEVLENARDWVFAPMESADFEQVLRGAQRFLTRYSRKPLLIKQLIIKLGQLTQKMPQVVAASGSGRGREAREATAEYAKLGSLLVENVTFLLGALNNVQQYCSLGDGRVDPTELYSADISSLV
jgi:hypothetical protein